MNARHVWVLVEILYSTFQSCAPDRECFILLLSKILSQNEKKKTWAESQVAFASGQIKDSKLGLWMSEFKFFLMYELKKKNAALWNIFSSKKVLFYYQGYWFGWAPSPEQEIEISMHWSLLYWGYVSGLYCDVINETFLVSPICLLKPVA